MTIESTIIERLAAQGEAMRRCDLAAELGVAERALTGILDEMQMNGEVDQYDAGATTYVAAGYRH